MHLRLIARPPTYRRCARTCRCHHGGRLQQQREGGATRLPAVDLRPGGGGGRIRSPMTVCEVVVGAGPVGSHVYVGGPLGPEVARSGRWSRGELAGLAGTGEAEQTPTHRSRCCSRLSSYAMEAPSIVE